MSGKINMFAAGFLLIASSCFAQNPSVNPAADGKPVAYEQPCLVQDELARLDSLIATTKRSLGDQIQLKEMVLEYLKDQAIYLEHPESKEQLIRTSKSARRALDAIRDRHLTQAFDSSFLSEITLFAKIVKKPAIKP